MKTFPSWLIRIASIGLGFFGFVIAAGVLGSLLTPIFGSLWGLTVILTAILPGAAAAYFLSKYSHAFMMRHALKGAAHQDHPIDVSKAQKIRIAVSLVFSGVVLFPVFIFMFLSSIINLYG